MENKKLLIITISTIFFLLVFPVKVFAQELSSQNYKIIDPIVDSGGGVSTSTNFDLLASLGNATSDSRLVSGSYAVGTGFPNGIQANVPVILCAESNTDSADTDCINFPTPNNGAQGICGTPGCYDRIKLEIDSQNNPLDTLYLVSITDTDTSTEYFLQSTNTIATTFDINDYMTICEIEGIDLRAGSGCEDSGDPDWNENLQEANVLNLTPGTTYDIKVRALNGDFTESPWSIVTSVTLEYPALSFDIDIADSGGVNAETPPLYSIDLGVLQTTTTTANDRIWLDLNTNISEGFSTYVKDLNSGLLNGAITIPSTSEDLDIDSGGDGGYGLKTETATEDALGPLQEDPTYSTAGANEVGGLSPTQELIFFTNTSGGNVGPVTNGRASLMVKARIPSGILAGTYEDTITFYMFSNI